MQFDCGLVEEILEAIWKNKIDTKYGKKNSFQAGKLIGIEL